MKISAHKEVHVLDMALDDLVQLNGSFRRYIPVLKSAGILRTQSLSNRIDSCELRDVRDSAQIIPW